MSKLFILSKTPCADFGWAVEWTGYFEDNDPIVESIFTVTPSTGLTVYDESINGDFALFKVKGGTLGQTFEIKNKVKTASGDEDCRIIRVEIVNKP